MTVEVVDKETTAQTPETPAAPPPGTEEAAYDAVKTAYLEMQAKNDPPADANPGAEEPKGEEPPAAPAAEDENTGAKEATDEEPDVRFDPALVAQAEALGLTEVDFKALGDNDRLKWAVDRLTPKTAKETPAKTEDAALETAPEVDTSKHFKLELDPMEWDEGTRTAFEGMQRHNDARADAALARVRAMEERLATITSALEERQAAEFSDRMDARFTALDEPYKEVLGEGTLAVLTPDSPFLAKRNEVVEAMAEIAAGRRAHGKPALQEDVLFQRALRAVLGEVAEKAAVKKVEEKVKRRSAQTINRPTSRDMRPDPKSPEDDAVAAVAARMAEWGHEPTGWQ